MVISLMKMRKKYIIFLCLFSFLIGLFFISLLQQVTLQNDTNRTRNELEKIIQSNPLVTKADSMTILPKDSQSPVTKAIKQGADYSREVSISSITITEANTKDGKVLEYVSLKRNRTSITFPIQLIIGLDVIFFFITLYFILIKNEKPELSPPIEILSKKAENNFAFTEFFQFPIFIFDNHGEIKFANSSFRNEFSPDQNIYQFSEHIDFLSFLLKKMLNPSLQDKLIHFEKLDADYEVNFHPLPDNERFMVTMNDVTVYKNAVNAQKELVANISHELKTPLTSIHGFSDLLENIPDLSVEKRQEFAKLISKESSRLLDLVSDIISLSKPQLSGIEMNSVQPQLIIESALQNLQQSIEHKKLIIKTELEDVTISSNEKRLQVILKNLIENAIFYANMNGKITIQLFKDNDGKTIFSISNTGPGLNNIEKSQIFERFYRSTNAGTFNPSGTGLGLAIVQKNLKELGGTIVVESQVGQETTFQVRL